MTDTSRISQNDQNRGPTSAAEAAESLETQFEQYRIIALLAWQVGYMVDSTEEFAIIRFMKIFTCKATAKHRRTVTSPLQEAQYDSEIEWWKHTHCRLHRAAKLSWAGYQS